MGPSINTGVKEAFPFVSFDEKYLFFMSNRISTLNKTRIPDGPGNVFWVEASIIDNHRLVLAGRNQILSSGSLDSLDSVAVLRQSISALKVKV